MTQTKRYQVDLWLFLASVACFAYILFMNVAYEYQWDHVVLIGVLEIITIPIILVCMIVPVVVVFRFISKKTVNRTLAMFTIFFSLLTAILIGYVSY